MPNYLSLKTGNWCLQHEVTCAPAAFHAWRALLPSIGFVIGQTAVPGKFRLWTIMESGVDLDHCLNSVARSTHASLHIRTWFCHTDAPYAGMQIACGGNYMVADHITEQSAQYFAEIQKQCCMHCCVELGLVTREEYEICRAENEALLKAYGLDQAPANQETEAPPEYSKLGITKPELLLCAVLDMKLRAQLDNPATPKETVRATFQAVKDLVLKLVNKASPGLSQVEKFMVIQTLFPNAKLKLVKLTPTGELEELQSGAPIPEPPVDDGTQSFAI